MKAYYFEIGDHALRLNAIRPDGLLVAPWYAPMSLGADFTADTSIREVKRLSKRYRKLTDFIRFSGPDQFIISQRVREVIEGVEPDIHQFLPFDVQQPNGAPFPVPYWGLNIRTHVDCYKWGKSTYFPTAERLGRPPSHEDDDPIGIHAPRQPEDLVLHLSAVQGLHLWRERRAKKAFVSDKMIAAFKRAKVNSFKIHEVTLI